MQVHLHGIHNIQEGVWSFQMAIPPPPLKAGLSSGGSSDADLDSVGVAMVGPGKGPIVALPPPLSPQLPLLVRLRAQQLRHRLLPCRVGDTVEHSSDERSSA